MTVENGSVRGRETTTDGFKTFLSEQIRRCRASTKKGIGYIGGTLWLCHFELMVFERLGRDSLLDAQNYAGLYVPYFKHVKRALLTDLWSVAEIRIREIVAEKGITVKSRSETARDLITHAQGLIRNTEACRLLNQAKRKLTGTFVEFPSCLSALLKYSRSTNTERKEWQNFFDIFRRMRNSVHNNFTCTETKCVRYGTWKYDFIKGQPLKIHYRDLERVIQETMRFFDAIET